MILKIKKLVLPVLRIERNVAWSFFTLKDTFTDDGRTVKPEFHLPVAYEGQRMTKFLDKIKCEYNLNHMAQKVESWMATVSFLGVVTYLFMVLIEL